MKRRATRITDQTSLDSALRWRAAAAGNRAAEAIIACHPRRRQHARPWASCPAPSPSPVSPAASGRSIYYWSADDIREIAWVIVVDQYSPGTRPARRPRGGRTSPASSVPAAGSRGCLALVRQHPDVPVAARSVTTSTATAACCGLVGDAGDPDLRHPMASRSRPALAAAQGPGAAANEARSSGRRRRCCTYRLEMG